MKYTKELEFEKAVIGLLSNNNWTEVIKNPSEQDLLDNWAKIIFDNNRNIDRLGDYPLTEGEMGQIVEQINEQRTPYNLNGWINRREISIVRDNSDDALHFEKEVYLKIYDPNEIGAGQSRYQIAEQPKFQTPNPLMSDRRGDFMILINGMPLIHVELKRSDTPVSQATNQIEKYTREGVFQRGIYSLVQVFVAMTPEETVYFANVGFDGKFNKDYFFHWANFNNEPINRWEDVAKDLLTIPMAHQITGYYLVADGGDGQLKVMRSYQYYASHAIADKVKKTKWDDIDIHGGHIWHTTGSGKTMTSFKSAQLISRSKDADKVVFLVDRCELGTQSLLEYQGFALDDESVNATENTYVLLSKLRSDNRNETLIVTSIQKLSRITQDSTYNNRDIEKINKKRIVIIVDECHRSTFGDMLQDIRKTFPRALFFGFTGTPILKENLKKGSTTSDVFGDELHRYSIADGIRDGNVLGFDHTPVLTFKEKEIRRAVALDQIHIGSENDFAIQEDDDEKTIAEKKKREELFYYYMNVAPMASTDEEKGIEDFLPKSQYDNDIHRNAVVDDIIENFPIISHGGKFHAIFATSSIAEAINYYELFHEKTPDMKITALYDSNIDNNGNAYIKEEATVRILEHYNQIYDQNFKMPSFDKYKKDVASRLAHKKPYLNIPSDKQIDVLIVVDQMLTGFDSKWVNTLYMDKELKYEGIIQSFSRTNRLFGHDKPFGVVRYYRRPYTMKKFIDQAFKTYSGDRPFGVFVDRLETNLTNMNAKFLEIKTLFESAGIKNFEKLPADDADRRMFAKLFVAFNRYLDSAEIQGFTWEQQQYTIKHDNEAELTIILQLDETTYNTLVARYKELRNGSGTHGEDELPYDLESYITEINTDKINSDYMQTHFEKWLKQLNGGEDADKMLEDLHNTFSVLSQEDQRFAHLLINDIQRGDLIVDESKTITDYITEYKVNAQNDRIHKFAESLGVDEQMLRQMLELNLDDSNINGFGRLDNLKATVDMEKAKAYLEQKTGTEMSMFQVKMKLDGILRNFIINNEG